MSRYRVFNPQYDSRYSVKFGLLSIWHVCCILIGCTACFYVETIKYPMPNEEPEIWMPLGYSSPDEPIVVPLDDPMLIFVARAFDPDNDDLEFHWTGPEGLEATHLPSENGIWTSTAKLPGDIELDGYQVIVQIWDQHNRVDIVWELVDPEVIQ